MKKIYAFLLIALVSFSFRVFDTTAHNLSVSDFTQNWSTTTQITADDNWSGVLSIQGFLGQNITTSTGVDPQTLLTVSALGGDVDVIANQSNTSIANGGIAEFDGIADPTIAFQGSGTADAPYINIYLNTLGRNNINVSYNLRDIDATTDDAIQRVALQYRVGGTGNYTNIPSAFVADATTGPSIATLVTPVSATLPAACENQSLVEVRIITSNAAGNDEWVGVDDINITSSGVVVKNVSLSGGGNIPEAGPAGSFTLTFSPATTAITTVDYSLTGTAALTTDYDITLNNGATPSPLTPASGTITVPSGVTSITMTVTPVNDLDTEADETIGLAISNASDSYVTGTASANATIIDNDAIDYISYTGVNYTQDFNSLASAGTASVTPAGWHFAESGANANTTYTANNGGSGTGDTYSYGSDADRAFGGLQSGSLIPSFGAKIVNNTGTAINTLQISYRGEQWRLGATGRNDRLDFQYSLDATSLTTGTWTNADGLDFIGPLSSGAVGAKDGNNPANYINYTSSLNGLAIPNGATFFIRWVDFNAASSDDGLAIDDFVLSPGCTPPTNQPTALNLTPALTSISGSFTAAAAGVVPADAYLVVMSTSPALTEQPVPGNVYAVDDIIGNGQVVSVNNSTSFTANGLNPATTYYFFVYSNSLPTNCYTIPSPLTGSTTTNSPPACTPPATQATGLNATSITGTSMDLNYTRGNGDNILIVARTGSAVNANPINGVNYPAGSQIGTGNFVIYNGPAATFPYTGLTQNTTYYFALYEYSIATPCYNTSALTGNFTTSCVTPVNVTGFSGTPQNTAVSLSWTNPTVSCFDEILVIASTTPITADGSTFVGAGSTIYGGSGDQVVFRGIGTSVTVTGLTNGTTYYFKVFTRNSGSYSSGVQITLSPFDPATGFMYLYGNLHSHSSYSDGNTDDETKIPADDFAYARDAICMDFLGISEHNHSTAGLAIANYKLGYNQANAINGVTGPNGNFLVTLWGMEWGTIGTGGHMLVYGFDDQLINWEAGNLDIFCERGDYITLTNLINARANAFATLAHPSSGDFNNLNSDPYDAARDAAIVGAAIESGPASSASTTYNHFPSPLGHIGYWRNLLAKGYRVGASVDQDNHKMTFGTVNSNRLVVLSPSKSRAEIVNAMRNMRFYASQDCNVQVNYRLNTQVVGSSVFGGAVPTITVTVVDLDGENAATIELWGAQAGSGSTPGSPIKTYPAVNTFTFDNTDVENTQPDNTTYYYYLIITQDDGNKIVTSPIWYTRSSVLPVTLMNFKAAYNTVNKTTGLTWSTAQEVNSKMFVVERSLDGGRNWVVLGTVAAAGTSVDFRHYTFTDLDPKVGTNLYRLKQVDLDDKFTYSRIVAVTVKSKTEVYFTAYPNPTSGYIYIYSNVSIPAKSLVQLVDVNGRVVKQEQVTLSNAAPAKVDLAGISSGIYFMRINHQGNITVQKVMVK